MAGHLAPAPDCPRCPRLASFRDANQAVHGDWHNAPVPSFGPSDAALLVVGLAPGLKGANRTGRPFTGDHAGTLLYETLRQFGFADGAYGANVDDGLRLIGCRITNAVRCVPPKNRPLPVEVANCRPFLEAEIGHLAQLRVIVALGRVAHDAVLAVFGLRPRERAFSHGAAHDIPPVLLLDSYHCSRQNTNTGRLTPDMFAAVFRTARLRLDG